MSRITTGLALLAVATAPQSATAFFPWRCCYPPPIYYPMWSPAPTVFVVPCVPVYEFALVPSAAHAEFAPKSPAAKPAVTEAPREPVRPLGFTDNTAPPSQASPPAQAAVPPPPAAAPAEGPPPINFDIPAFDPPAAPRAEVPKAEPPKAAPPSTELPKFAPPRGRDAQGRSAAGSAAREGLRRAAGARPFDPGSDRTRHPECRTRAVGDRQPDSPHPADSLIADCTARSGIERRKRVAASGPTARDPHGREDDLAGESARGPGSRDPERAADSRHVPLRTHADGAAAGRLLQPFRTRLGACR